MVIDVICNDGSPMGVTPPEIYGKGVGGAENAMMSLMEAFANRGHEVRVYNDPRSPGIYAGVKYEPKEKFNQRGGRDVLIVFRSPNPLLVGTVAKTKIWWSTDQYTVGSFKALSELVDFCVTISPHHTNFHLKNYGIDPKKIGHIDLGVRLRDYEGGRVEKVKNRLIYCSVPDRGLQILHSAWPLIQRAVPDATLTITSDYTLWGVGANDSQHRLNWAGMTGVSYLGNVNRAELVKLQLQAEIMAYPCTYDELFCVSAAECQVSGALPFTTTSGALPTTNKFGIQISGNLHNPATMREMFVDRIAALLTTERVLLESKIKQMQIAARLRFDWDKIAERWEYLFQHGRLSE